MAEEVGLDSVEHASKSQIVLPVTKSPRGYSFAWAFFDYFEFARFARFRSSPERSKDALRSVRAIASLLGLRHTGRHSWS